MKCMFSRLVGRLLFCGLFEKHRAPMRFQPFSPSLFHSFLPHLTFFRLFHALFPLFCFSPCYPLVSRGSSVSRPICLCGSAPSHRVLTSAMARAFFMPPVPLLYVLRSAFYVLCFVPYALRSVSLFRPFCSLFVAMAALLLAVMFGLLFSLAGIAVFLPFFRFFLLLFAFFTHLC